MKNLIVASTSTLHGSSFLEYLLPELKDHFQQIKTLLFVPFARPGGISHDAYTNHVREGLKALKIEVKGLHEFKDQARAVEEAEGVFTGGGNTFVLLDELQRKNLIEPLARIIRNGVPYLGTSAGSNIVGPTVRSTNDMPIVHPKSLDALGLIPFNINPHYLDPDPDSKHKGETRETRIKEFHCFNDTPVIGLREGSWISVKGEQMKLKGSLSARVFIKNKVPFEAEPGYMFSQLS